MAENKHKRQEAFKKQDKKSLSFSNLWGVAGRQEIMELKEEARSKSIQEIMKRRARGNR